MKLMSSGRVSYAAMNFYLTERPRPSIQPDPVEATRLAPLPEAASAVKMEEAPAITAPEPAPVTVAPTQTAPATEAVPADEAKPAPAPEKPAGPRPAPIDLTNIRRGTPE